MSVLPPSLLPPPAPPSAELRSLFGLLAAEWKQKAVYLSNEVHAAMLPPYQRIIGLGPAAVPLILEELGREPANWFWALEAITGENPVPSDAGGRVNVMVGAWLDWGRARGLLV